MTQSRHDRILLAHGGGGRLTDDLIRNHILTKLRNDTLARLGDSAVVNLDSNSLCFTTDSYVVKPLFFNGGGDNYWVDAGVIEELRAVPR